MSQNKQKKDKHKFLQLRYYGKRKRFSYDEKKEESLKKVSDWLGLSHDKIIELGFRTTYEHLVRSSRIANKEGKHKVIINDEESFKKICKNLGLNYESAVSCLQEIVDQYGLIENDVIPIHFSLEPKHIDLGQIFTTHEYHKQNRNSPNKYSTAQYELKLDLKMTMYSEEDDPILLTREALMKSYDVDNFSKLLKVFYFDFLVQNSLIDNNWNLKLDYARRISCCNCFQPYGWSINPMDDINDLKSGKLNYSFLKPGPHKRRKPFSITLKLKDYHGLVIRETLHIFCHYLFRSESAFFKMLYMYRLKNLGLLDNNFYLRKTWKTKLDLLDSE